MLHHLKVFLEKRDIGYALIGGVALHAYGYTRQTKDIDFVTITENRDALKTFFEELGFETLQHTTVFSIFLHPLSDDRFDFTYVDNRTAATLFKTTHPYALDESITLPVVSALHLSMMKAQAAQENPARRNKDLEDIHQLYLRGVISKEDLTPILEKYHVAGYFSYLYQDEDIL